MFKVIGSLCIIGSCTYLGLRISSVYKQRTEMFRFLQNALTLLETEINFTATPLPLALERVGQKTNRNCRSLFTKAATVLQEKKGSTASEAWAEGIMALSGEVPLTEEERELLQVFGHGLGGSAKEEQVKNINLTRKQLRQAEKAAEEEQLKNQRMWQYLGFCLGAVIVLILI
jgi:stage III sporulation protein AB